MRASLLSIAFAQAVTTNMQHAVFPLALHAITQGQKVFVVLLCVFSGQASFSVSWLPVLAVPSSVAFPSVVVPVLAKLQLGSPVQQSV